MAVQANIKGISLVHLWDFVVSNHGEKGRQQVLTGLEPHTRRVLELARATEWYPLKHLIEFERRIVDLYYGGDPSEAWRFGQHDLERSVGSVYKLLFPLFTPTYLIKRAPQLFSSMISQGSVRIEERSSRQVEVCIEGLDPIDEIYCHDMRGSMIGMLKVCGVQANVEHPECRLRGAPCCRYVIDW